MNTLTQPQDSKKLSYFDTYLEICQFPEFRGNPNFAQFIIEKAGYIPTVLAKADEIKQKYDFAGKPLTLDKWLEILVAENVYPLADEEVKARDRRNMRGFCCKLESGQSAIWVSGKLSLEEALPVAAPELAHYLFGHHEQNFERCPRLRSGEALLDKLTHYPTELKSEIEADLLAAVLISPELPFIAYHPFDDEEMNAKFNKLVLKFDRMSAKQKLKFVSELGSYESVIMEQFSEPLTVGVKGFMDRTISFFKQRIPEVPKPDITNLEKGNSIMMRQTPGGIEYVRHNFPTDIKTLKNLSRNASKKDDDLASTRLRMSYRFKEFEVITTPLRTKGIKAYLIKDEQLIFVNSKLPKAERSESIKRIIQEVAK